MKGTPLLIPGLKGVVKENEPLAPHTAWHIGGPAEHYYCPYDISDLSHFLQHLPKEEPLYWLGLGSNVLIPDEGLKGTVIHTLGMLPHSPLMEESGVGLIRAEASIPCAKLAKFSAKQGFLGGEFFAGIPGTVGGALWMNAGAFGGETWSFVESVEVINRQGIITKRFPNEYRIQYRSARLLANNEEWFVRAYFRFHSGVGTEEDANQALEKIKELLKKRGQSQPIGVFSCGSVFKNPPGDYAGRLIEACGLKGHAIGDAEISAKHANFIINHGRARATEVLALIEFVKQKVWEVHGVKLETEVQKLGFL